MRTRHGGLLRIASIVAVGVLAAFPVSAEAPADQYDYFSESSTSIKDNFTKLRWERRSSDAPLSFAQAIDFCKEGIPPKGGSYRLPTLKELLTLVDEEPHQDYEGLRTVNVMIDDFAFPRTPASEAFWSQSMIDATKARTVSFESGETGEGGPNDKRFVRCVIYEP